MADHPVSTARPIRAALLALLGLGLWLLGIGLSLWASMHPDWIEHQYARGFQPGMARCLSWTSNWIPLPLGESIAILGISVGLVGSLCWLWRNRQPWKRLFQTLGFLLAMVCLLSGALYFSFVGLLGLNYYRSPLAVQLGWNHPQSWQAENLNTLLDDLLHRASELRQTLPEDSQGVLRLPSNLLFTGSSAFPRLAELIPIPLPQPSDRVKNSLISPLMSRALVTGAYCPWTGEALVNAHTPAAILPFTICHELAHSSGFAREEEASLVGFLASQTHSDPIFKYSGQMAMIRELGRRGAQPSSIDGLHPGLSRDMTADMRWILEHRGLIATTQGMVYNQFLKSQGQSAGVQSYGRVVELLLGLRYEAHQGRLNPGLARTLPFSAN